jgi:ATP synthase protein I
MSGQPGEGPAEEQGPARGEPHTPIPSPHGGTEAHVPGVARQTDLGNAVIAYLIAGPMTFGGLGWLLDRVLDTRFLLPVGVVLGMVLSLYVIWLRYGRS